MVRIIGTLLVLLLTSVTVPASAQEAIRVRLFDEEAPQALTVEPEGGIVRLYAGDIDNELTALRPNEQATIRRRGNEVVVNTNHLSFYAMDLRLVPEAAALLNVAVTDGASQVAPRQYAGELALAVDASSTLRVVNQLPLEQYVAAVVAREYGFDDLEGAKAMAVLARTHAVRRLGMEVAYDPVDAAFDQVDSGLAQKYDGAGRLTPSALEATRQTAGEVLMYHGELIEAVYSASNGGHTANNDDVWDGEPLPYLRGRPDPYDTAHRGWEGVVPRDPLLRVLSRTYGFEVGGFYLGDLGPDGRIHTIELLDPGLSTARTIRSNEFRLLVNRHFGHDAIKSTLFDARRDGNRYIFTGAGFGHGVGLSQNGALEMSRQGYDYRAILDFYFPNVDLQRVDGEALPPRLVTQSPPQTPPSWSNPVEQKPDEKSSSSRRRVGW